VAVKVLSDTGSGAYSDVISGVDWSFAQFLASGTPSIATMSLGGPISAALDSAVSNVSLYPHSLLCLYERLAIGHRWGAALYGRRVEFKLQRCSVQS
jgi:hypothetical protein